ncbi:MAG: 4Fe-4S binding protein [Treponema sp.]|jgi:ferredoxin|nr:4Fe-4S binding protein [Treponema sp.]
MVRKIIKIDRALCNGCGLCAGACHEGAIEMRDGKAALVRDDYCDGLGNCLPACPAGAISFEEREAAAYDGEAVKRNRQQKAGDLPSGDRGCPGVLARTLAPGESPAPEPVQSGLTHWPVQIRLLPVHASCFENAELLVSADCAAYACGNFHGVFMRNRVTLIGCPKLDDVDYSEKLTAIITENSVKSVTVVRMEVPCCGGITMYVKKALENSGKTIPCRSVTCSIQGEILEEVEL